MKNLLSLAVLATLFTSVEAATINKIDVYPPYLNVGCSNLATDNVGTLGISLNKLSAKETESKITLSVDQSLKVCELKLDGNNGSKTLEWKVVNPFEGFDAQYFDFKTSSIQNRFNIIESQSLANRYELALYNEETKTKVSSTFSENKTNSADIELNKANLLNQNDIDTLDNGKEVKKTLVLFNILNITSYVNHEKIEMGDQPFSGRNVTITFGKAKNLVKIKSISLQ